MLTSEAVLLALHDRAPQVNNKFWNTFLVHDCTLRTEPRSKSKYLLKWKCDNLKQVTVSEDRLCTIGHKFYCTIRANHYVNRGTWYFEAKIVDLPEGAATRIGWAQKNANLQVILLLIIMSAVAKFKLSETTYFIRNFNLIVPPWF